MKTTIFISAFLALAAGNALAQGGLMPLPDSAENANNPTTAEKVDLGRQLYFDKRLSLSQEISCNSCHGLDTFGVDGVAGSVGHEGHITGRNSPTVYNAAIHVAQFWDGRAADVEEQDGGPILAGGEMAMPSEEALLKVVKSIPGYVESFKAAFPGEEDPITYANLTAAIGCFERGLLTPGPVDAYLKGDETALNADQIRGLETFVATGCTTCHMGPAVGGMIYQKLGLVEAWPDLEDKGRGAHTGNEAENYFFKVPSLRNIEHTGPYLHDGSVTDLAEMTQLMAKHQLGKELSDEDTADIVTFLKALTGEVDAEYTAEPELPESGPNTPGPGEAS